MTESGTVARDGFGLDTKRGGLAVGTLNPRTVLVVKTRHSFYKITVLDGQRLLVLVEGGFFPEPTVVCLSGATLGGSAVKLGWIVAGLRIEFGLGPRRVVTSPVSSMTLEPPSSSRATDEKAA